MGNRQITIGGNALYATIQQAGITPNSTIAVLMIVSLVMEDHKIISKANVPYATM